MILNTKRDEMIFQERTNIFHLIVVLVDNKLTITLEDYDSCVIYSKEYSQDDYSKDIHKKMDLLDVYNAFSRSQNDQNTNEKQEIPFYDYAFGTIVYKNQLPCYKINKGGVVITFHTVIDKYSKKQVTYESKLVLKKDRNLTETEILVHKPISEKTTSGKQVQLEREQKNLLGRVKGLEQKLQKREVNQDDRKQKLKDSTEQIRLLSQTNSQLLQQNRRLEQKFIQLMEQFELQNQRNRSNFEKIELELKQTYRANKTQHICQIHSIHRLAQANSHHFIVRGFQVRNTQKLHLHYIFNHPIQPNQSTQFKFRIGQATHNEIAIGIVDYEQQKDKSYSSTSGHAMCYYGHDASLYPSQRLGLRKTGSGFKAGDIDKVEVDREESSVRYSVNGVINAVQTNYMLANKSSIFMPFVEMRFAGDSVEWIP